MELLGYFLASLMGMTLGLIGAGGSILALPILVYFFNVEPVTATGYSLLLVGFTALIGSLRYYFKKQIAVKTIILFAPPSILAVYLTRAFLLPAIPEVLFTFENFTFSKSLFIMLLFACLMLISALFMIHNGKAISKFPSQKNHPYRHFYIILDGAIVGCLTGMVGAGGGFLIIPALVLLTGLDMKIAVGTSLFIIAAKSLIGFIGDVQAGIFINYHLISLFLLSTTIGIFTGEFLSKYLSAQRLKQAFGWFTLIVSIIIFIKEL